MPTPWYLREEVLDLLAVIQTAGLETETYREHGDIRERFVEGPLYSSLQAWHAQAFHGAQHAFRVWPDQVAAAVTGVRLQGFHWDDADERLMPLRDEVRAALAGREMAEAA
jgi:hypothetical protein